MEVRKTQKMELSCVFTVLTVFSKELLIHTKQIERKKEQEKNTKFILIHIKISMLL
jgi:hypothetical protein